MSAIEPFFEPSRYLRSVWDRINERAFESRLPAITEIGWHFLGEEDCNIYGGYAARVNQIGITHILKRAEEIEATIESLRRADPCNPSFFQSVPKHDLNLLLALDGVVAHEMVHQAVYLNGGSTSSHGEEFVHHATIVATTLGLPEVSATHAGAWPYVQLIIEHERTL